VDLGQFRRSKLEFWAWIVGPVLLVGVLHYAAYTYCRCTGRLLEERRAFIVALPETRRALATAADTLASFGVAAESAADAADDFTTELNEAAHECGVAINSLRVVETTEAGEEVAVFEATLEGVGGLAAVTRFLDEFRGPDSLIAVTSAKIRATGVAADSVYSGEFVLRFCAAAM